MEDYKASCSRETWESVAKREKKTKIVFFSCYAAGAVVLR
jgi:hypothetical protein